MVKVGITVTVYNRVPTMEVFINGTVHISVPTADVVTIAVYTVVLPWLRLSLE